MKKIILAIALSLALISDNAIATNFSKIGSFGPGNRIHGMDISRWQHPNDQPIDFKKMYDAGVRFVLIKGSDTLDKSDALARKYLASEIGRAHV